MPTGCACTSSSTGTGDPIQVVCGAPNARTGMTGVFSPPGTYIPGKKITLDATAKDIRGVKSSGMLVSEAEIELSDNHEGIIDLPPGAPVGESYAKWAGLDDPVIEINLTPNRPDCTSVHGIARDLAAAGMGVLIDPVSKLANRPPADHPRDRQVRTTKVGSVGCGNDSWSSPRRPGFAPRSCKRAPCPVSVTIESPEFCPGFALRVVRGVKNGPSPEWLQKRLIAIGLRPSTHWSTSPTS